MDLTPHYCCGGLLGGCLYDQDAKEEAPGAEPGYQIDGVTINDNNLSKIKLVLIDKVKQNFLFKNNSTCIHANYLIGEIKL